MTNKEVMEKLSTSDKMKIGVGASTAFRNRDGSSKNIGIEEVLQEQMKKKKMRTKEEEERLKYKYQVATAQKQEAKAAAGVGHYKLQ